MDNLFVDRFEMTPEVTFSRISLNDEFLCYGLEDIYREVKIPGKTRIPSGRYKVGVRTVGGFHSRYSRDFPGWHKGMLHILDVPQFTYVLIHIGNFERNTDGCLLVGSSYNIEQNMIGSSKVTYEKFYKAVIDKALAGDLWIEFKDTQDPTRNAPLRVIA